MDSWQFDDIPIGKYNVITEPNHVTGEIKQITEIADKITEEIIQTKADQVRNALIDMGWTPPEGKEYVPESKLPGGWREEYMKGVDQIYFAGVKVMELPLYDLFAVIGYFTRKDPGSTTWKGLNDIE